MPTLQPPVFNRRQSPLELEIRLHYADVEHDSGPITFTRLDVLCKLLKISRYELARLIRVAPHKLHEPTQLVSINPAARLLFLIIERAAFKKYLGKEYPISVFPLLPQ